MPIIEGSHGDPLLYDGVPSAGTDQVWTVTIGGTPDGGTFKLAFDGYSTAAITWSATTNTMIAAVDAAMEALSSVGTGGVVTADVDLSSGIGTFTITAGGNLAKRLLGGITVAANNLTGTDPTVAAEITTPGVDATGRGSSKGSLLVDVTNAIAYINTGTPLSPTWTVIGSQSY